MANTKTKTKSTKYSKPNKTSIFLCCFGSPMVPEIKETDPLPKQKRASRFSWPRIRFKNNNMMKSTSKTVPLEASFSDNKANIYPQSRSKSTLHQKSPPPTPPPQVPVVLSATPHHSPSQTRHGAINNVEHTDTREQGTTSTPTRPKRQAQRLSSPSVQSQTTPKKYKTVAASSYDALVGMSVLGVTLLIMIFWGRLCAILCTSAWLYFIPRFRKTAAVIDDDVDGLDESRPNNVVVDLDSEVYKKKVIMEGLLGRNHRGGGSSSV